jgi:esterase/lipase superfamily enzyme
VRHGTVLVRLLLCTAFAVAGCHHAAPLLRPTPGSARRRDTVWYVSARARADGRDSRQLADSLEFGQVIFTREGDASGARQSMGDSVRFTADAFVTALRARVERSAPPYDFAVWYVHGFGTSLHEAWTHAAAAQALAGGDVPWVVFCWPSNGAGITWPDRNDLLVRAYREDNAAALASVDAFDDASDVVLTAVPASQLVVAAHSLGAQLVAELLADSTRRTFSAARAPLRALAFLTPDIGAARLADTLLPRLTTRAARTLLYVSARDRALMVAQNIHDVPRAGLRQSPTLVRAGLETVDVTSASTTEGWFQRQVGTHHSIRRASGMLFDLTHVAGAMRAPVCRTLLHTGQLMPDGSWQLRRSSPMSASMLQRCPPAPERTR